MSARASLYSPSKQAPWKLLWGEFKDNGWYREQRVRNLFSDMQENFKFQAWQTAPTGAKFKRTLLRSQRIWLCFNLIQHLIMGKAKAVCLPQPHLDRRHSGTILSYSRIDNQSSYHDYRAAITQDHLWDYSSVKSLPFAKAYTPKDLHLKLLKKPLDWTAISLSKHEPFSIKDFLIV